MDAGSSDSWTVSSTQSEGLISRGVHRPALPGPSSGVTSPDSQLSERPISWVVELVELAEYTLKLRPTVDGLFDVRLLSGEPIAAVA